MEEYFKSDNITIYPAAGRSKNNSRFNTEYNLVNIVNRLTDIESFIVSGLIVSESGGKIKISSGQCNINGYYIKINDTLTGFNFNTTENIFIKLNMNTTDDELSGVDDSDDYYKAVEITTTQPGEGIHYLQIAQKKDGQFIKVNDGLKFKDNSIKITSEKTEGLHTTNSTIISLNDLLDNFIIDDGDLD